MKLLPGESGDQSSVMAGHSCPKGGVASARLRPGARRTPTDRPISSTYVQTFFAALALLRALLLFRRDFRSLPPCLGQADRDRLLAALDLPSRATALQGAGLALLHRAPDLGGRLSRIFSCHGNSPGCGKIIFAVPDGSLRLPPAVRQRSSKAPMYSLQHAIERESPAISMSAPPVRALRAIHAPPPRATGEQIRCPPLARRWRRIRSAT